MEKQLSSICSIKKGEQINTALLDDSYPYRYMNGGTSESGFYNKFNTKGETVTVCEGGSCGFVNYLEDDFWCGCHCYKIKPFEGYLPKYIFYALKCNQDRLEALKTGIAIPNIKKSAISDFTIDVSDNFQEQKAIVEELDLLTECRDKRNEQIKQLDRLVWSEYYEMFGNPFVNDKGWKEYSMESIGTISVGNTPSRKDSRNYDSGFIEWIKSDNLSDNSIFPSSAKEYLSEYGAKKGRIAKVGDILITCIAGSLKTIGVCGLLDREAAFNQQMIAISFSPDVMPLYALHCIRALKRVIQDKASNGMKHMISKATFGSIKIPVPPFNLQNRFAEKVLSIERMKTLLTDSLFEHQIILDATMAKYFRKL
jgi:type I restriction enzyme S subunit